MFSALRCTDSIARSTMSPSSVVSISTLVELPLPFRTLLSDTSLLIACTVLMSSAASFNSETRSRFSLLDSLSTPSSIRSARTSSSERPVASARVLALRTSISKSSGFSATLHTCLMFFYYHCMLMLVNFSFSFMLKVCWYFSDFCCLF